MGAQFSDLVSYECFDSRHHQGELFRSRGRYVDEVSTRFDDSNCLLCISQRRATILWVLGLFAHSPHNDLAQRPRSIWVHT
jgi:hypothetical protein